MYAPKGVSFSDVGDIEVLPNGDDLHLFHLTLPNHDVVQHRVSTDGLSWQALPAALRTSDPGPCDDDQIWTMSVTPHDGRFYMLYTALATAEGGRVQRTALATSDDLTHWIKSDRNPVAEADPRWYESTVEESGAVSWRDPKPIKVGETYYAAVNAREATGPIMRRGCVGLFSSTDMEKWTVHPPLFAPRKYWDLECPQVFHIGERFYLTASIMEDGTQRYWVASRFEGPYEVPADGGVLAPLGHYAGRVCQWNGENLYVCWHEPRPRNRSRTPLPPVDWATVRNPAGKFVVAPLELTPRADGSLACRSFSGWATYRTAELVPPTPMATSLLHSAPSPANTWQIQNDAGGMDLLASDDPVGDVWFEGVLAFDAVAGGLAFRLDDDASGYFVSLTAGSQEITLQKWLPTRDPHSGRPGFAMTLLQRGALRQPVQPGAHIPFRLLAVGPYIECSLNGEVVLATLSGQRTAGRIGIWAESGTITASDLLHAPMRQPEHG